VKETKKGSLGREVWYAVKAYVMARMVVDSIKRTMLDLDKDKELGGDLNQVTAEQFSMFLKNTIKRLDEMSPDEVQEFVNSRMEGLPEGRKKRLRNILKAMIKAGRDKKSG